MNNKSKILMSCLAILLVVSIGYALFSETISVNGTATASGTFDLEYTCELITENTDVSMFDYSIVSSAKGKCLIENGVIKTTSTLSKPTEGNAFKIIINNKGTIPVLLKNLKSSNNKAMNNDDSINAYFNEYNLIGSYLIKKIGTSNSYMTDKDSINAKIVLNNNESIGILVSHGWFNNDNLQPTVPKDGAVMNYNMKLDFEQITAN